MKASYLPVPAHSRTVITGAPVLQKQSHEIHAQFCLERNLTNNRAESKFFALPGVRIQTTRRIHCFEFGAQNGVLKVLGTSGEFYAYGTRIFELMTLSSPQKQNHRLFMTSHNKPESQ